MILVQERNAYGVACIVVKHCGYLAWLLRMPIVLALHCFLTSLSYHVIMRMGIPNVVS